MGDTGGEPSARRGRGGSGWGRRSRPRRAELRSRGGGRGTMVDTGGEPSERRWRVISVGGTGRPGSVHGRGSSPGPGGRCASSTWTGRAWAGARGGGAGRPGSVHGRGSSPGPGGRCASSTWTGLSGKGQKERFSGSIRQTTRGRRSAAPRAPPPGAGVCGKGGKGRFGGSIR